MEEFNMLKVILVTGEIVEVPTQSFVVKTWNAGKWHNQKVFLPTEYDLAVKYSNDLMTDGWVHVYIVQLF